MRILHTADLHLGQILYHNYERADEHRYFFSQLEDWCRRFSPDALIISGDIYDVQQPAASVCREFSDLIVHFHKCCPEVKIVIVAGNHDSATRIGANMPVWKLAGLTLIGQAPQNDTSSLPADWPEDFIVALPTGYIIALPYMGVERPDVIRQILDYVKTVNRNDLPVVMTGHTTVTGSDISGQDVEIGNVRFTSPESFGTGYDYLALGHIHRPQIIGKGDRSFPLEEPITLQGPVISYSGSALHVSQDEAYPHSVNLVDIDRSGGEVTIRRLRIEQLRHFYTLPLEKNQMFENSDDVIEEVEKFCKSGKEGYIRLRIPESLYLPADFNQRIYDIIESSGDRVRYNPKFLREGEAADDFDRKEEKRFAVADLQQMSSPLRFIEETIDRYPGLNMGIDELREAFQEIEDYLKTTDDQ